MRVKNVLIGFAGVITLFTACSEEIPIVDSHTGSFSISFSADPITSPTKSGTEEATSQERSVSSCFIGFFELNNGVPGDMIKGDSYNQPVGLSNNEYRVNDIILPEDKTDKPVRILVIANPPVGNSYEEYSSYSDFTDISSGKGIVSYRNAASFVPSTLIKVGETDFDFSKEEKTASVNLRQLAAKVLVSFSLDKDVEMSGITVGVDNVVLNSPLLISPEMSFEESLGVLNAQPVVMTTEKTIDYTFYTYQKEYTTYVAGDELTVQVKGRFPHSSNDITYKAIINPEYTDTSTEGVLAGNYYKATATLKVNDSFETTVNWVVVDIEEVKDIDIPSFE